MSAPGPNEPPRVDLDKFDADIKSRYTEVSTSAVGAKVIGASDDFFVSRHNLIKSTPSVYMRGDFGPNGALYDGWETRRHNPEFDWVIIQLAPHQSKLFYCDIDTAHFKGNECPQSQVFGLHLDEPAGDDLKLSDKDPRWVELLPLVTLGPDSRHIYELNETAKTGLWSALMVRMIPDGGMARFRAYGVPLPPKMHETLPGPEVEPINLLSPLIGGHIVDCSDANFSPPNNLLLPGRGIDMSDGWETRRSQVGRGKYAPGQPLAGQERKEWAVARFGATGTVSYVEVDAAYHVGNYPVSVTVEATLHDGSVPPADAKWTTIARNTPHGPHRDLWLARERNVPATAVFSHVRVSMYPDGGLKRLRVFGHPISPNTKLATPADVVTALPLTYEAFGPYGNVIQGWGADTSAPKGIRVNIANQGTAFKFHRLAPMAAEGLNLSVVRAEAKHDVRKGALIPVEKLERVQNAEQAFIPMGTGAAAGETALTAGGTSLVVVALNGADNKPDLSTLRAFLPTSAQGVSYKAGVWHLPLVAVNETLDVLVTDSATHKTESAEGAYPAVYVPAYNPAPAPTHRPSRTISPASKIASALNLGGQSHPEPISHKGFAPFGDIVRLSTPTQAPSSAVRTQDAAAGTTKLANLAPLSSSYGADTGAVSAIGVYRATPKVGLERGKTFDIRFMERHPYTTQVFAPMGKSQWADKGEDALPPGGSFLLIVAENGKDDKPDPATLRTFIMESGTALSYRAGTWHHPVLVLDATLDLACIETQITTGANGETVDPRDCELLTWEGEEVFGRVAVPEL